MMINSSILINYNSDYVDHFPSPYEDFDETYYDNFIFNNNQTFNLTKFDILSLSSIFSFSNPLSYIIFILITYLILTFILLLLSLYKQRQYSYFEDINKIKRCLLWKQTLIGKITKGDMEPLLVETYSNSDQSKIMTFPLEIV